MARRHLRELLREEQEPFILKTYIDERRSHLRRRPLPPRTHPHAKRRLPISQNIDVTSTQPKSSLLSPFNNASSDASGSSLLDFPGKTPSSARRATAQLLIQAAVRIHENIEMEKSRKTTCSIKDLGFGLFATVLKRLVLRRRRCEIAAKETTISAKVICGRNPQAALLVQEKLCPELCRSSSSKKMIETEKDSNAMVSSSCYEEMGSSEEERPAESGSVDDGRGSRPSTPHIVPSEENASAEFESPAASPRRFEIEQAQKQLFGADDDRKRKKEYDEEEKEQFSPVSVLEPLFHEEDEDHCDGHVEQYHCSLALVQKAKQQLLHQISRFERLAELDPIELDKLLAEEDNLNVVHTSSNEIDHSHRCCDFDELPELVEDIITGSSGCCCDRGRLVSDVIQEEKGVACDVEGLAERVVERFEAWKQVGSNTIDMMVESELSRVGKDWGRRDEQVQVAASQIEFAIFELLVWEFCNELVASTDPTMT